MGCLPLLILGAVTWVLIYMLVGLLSWLLDFSMTVGMVTAAWVIFIILKLLF